MRQAQLIERLQKLQEGAGPCVSLYMNTEGAREQGADELQLRWRGLRERAADHVPDKALLLLDDIVDGAHQVGDGLVSFTSGEEIAFRRFLESPIADEVQTGPLPHLVPLFEWMQDHPTFALVVMDRAGGGIHVVGGMREDVTIEIQGDHDELRKVNPGGWSQRRFQNRAEDSWDQNAEKVAEALGRIVHAEPIELVIVMGDVRAVTYLKEHCAPDVAALVYDIEGAPPTGDDLESVRPEIERGVAATVGRSIEALLDTFVEERGQHDLAVEGVADTLSALSMSQVDTLLVARSGVEGTAWFSRSDATQGALDGAALAEIGLDDVEEAPAEDVLVRLALATGASIRVIPELREESGPAGGVGAILRFKTETAPSS